MTDLQSALRSIVEADGHMTPATTGEDARPWAAPVWSATHDHREELGPA